MEIGAALWKRYIDRLRKVNDHAADLVRKFLTERGIPETQAAMNALIDYAFGVSTTHSEAAAAIAAEMYDAMAELSGVSLPPALPAPVPVISEVAKAVVGTAKTGNEEIISSSIGRLVKRTGVDTTMQNAIRDEAEWAWIPSGETCAFCITLASRGWQPASRKALAGGHAEHIHANCDCTYAVRWDHRSTVSGYAPERYKRMYDDADGRNSTAKINSLRREFYAENSEEINAQKRDAYAKRQERESSEAEELDV